MPKSTPLKARDLRVNIKELGFEKGVVMTLELLLDEWAGMRQGMVDMANVQTQMIDTLTDVTNVGHHIATQMKEMKRKEEQFDSVRGAGIGSDNMQ